MATKIDLIHKIVTKLDYLSKEDASIAVDCVLGCIENELCKKNRIEIRGFGSMSIRGRKYPGQDKKYNAIYFRMSRNVQDALK